MHAGGYGSRDAPLIIALAVMLALGIWTFLSSAFLLIKVNQALALRHPSSDGTRSQRLRMEGDFALSLSLSAFLCLEGGAAWRRFEKLSS